VQSYDHLNCPCTAPGWTTAVVSTSLDSVVHDLMDRKLIGINQSYIFVNTWWDTSDRSHQNSCVYKPAQYGGGMSLLSDGYMTRKSLIIDDLYPRRCEHVTFQDTATENLSGVGPSCKCWVM
jgi:hypothetical protein